MKFQIIFLVILGLTSGFAFETTTEWPTTTTEEIEHENPKVVRKVLDASADKNTASIPKLKDEETFRDKKVRDIGFNATSMKLHEKPMVLRSTVDEPMNITSEKPKVIHVRDSPMLNATTEKPAIKVRRAIEETHMKSEKVEKSKADNKPIEELTDDERKSKFLGLGLGIGFYGGGWGGYPYGGGYGGWGPYGGGPYYG